MSHSLREYPRLRYALVLFLLGAWASLSANAQTRLSATKMPHREMALTFDDLPKVVPLPARPEEVNQIYLTTVRLLEALRAHQAPAMGFVSAIKLNGSDRRARVAILRLWTQSGMMLGNHSYSHPNLCTTPLVPFEQDVLKDENVIFGLMREKGLTQRYFRYPYLCTGKTIAEKQAFENFLREHRYRIAPVTVAPGDYIFNELFLDARSRGDRETARRVREAYLERVSELLAYFEGVSRRLFGREIPQIILLHANDLNADCLDELLTRVEQRGYTFVDLDRALSDPAYQTRDDYVGPLGISWLHRWTLALGAPFDIDTQPPLANWVQAEYAKLHAR